MDADGCAENVGAGPAGACRAKTRRHDAKHDAGHDAGHDARNDTGHGIRNETGNETRRHEGRSPARGAGFTLIELLVVVTVIGILAAVAIPQFGGYRRRGFDADAQANVRNMALAQEVYHMENNTYTSNVADLATFGYTRSANITAAVTSADDSTFTATATVTEGCADNTGVATYDRATGRVTLVKCTP